MSADNDWVLVPREPTEAMVEAGVDANRHLKGTDGVYRAMLAAAPAAPPLYRRWIGMR